MGYGSLHQKFDPRPPGGSPIRLKIKWHPDFCFSVRVTPHPAWDSPDGTLKGKDEIATHAIQSTFDGRPCPPEFVRELTELRERGLLDSPRLKAAFIAAAKNVRAELAQEQTKGAKTALQNHSLESHGSNIDFPEQ